MSTSAATVPDDASADARPPMAGWFGKIPALGDFASRRLSDDFIEFWDTWLSEAIAEAQQTLGEQWRSAYVEGPTWVFVLMPETFDTAHWYGLMAPSTDRVGRLFPLTFAARSEIAAQRLVAWWLALVAIAALTRSGGCDADALEALLIAADECEPKSAPAQSNEVPMTAQLATALPGASLWWPWRPESKDFGLALVFDGLPSGPAFLQLLGPATPTGSESAEEG